MQHLDIWISIYSLLNTRLNKHQKILKGSFMLERKIVFFQPSLDHLIWIKGPFPTVRLIQLSLRTKFKIEEQSVVKRSFLINCIELKKSCLAITIQLHAKQAT